MTRAQSYIDASTLADNKVQVMYSAVGSMTDIITQLRTQLSAATVGSSTASGLGDQLRPAGAVADAGLAQHPV